MRYILFSPEVTAQIDSHGGVETLPQLPVSEVKCVPCKKPEDFDLKASLYRAPLIYFLEGIDTGKVLERLKANQPGVVIEPSIQIVKDYEDLCASLDNYLQDNLMVQVESLLSDLITSVGAETTVGNMFNSPSDAEGKLSDLSEKIAQYENTLQSLESENKALKEQIDNKSGLVTSMQSQVIDYETRVKAQDAEILDLNNTLVKLKAEQAKLLGEYESLKAQQELVTAPGESKSIDFSKFDVLNSVQIVAIENIKAYGQFVNDIGITQDCIILDTTEYSILDAPYKYTQVVKDKQFMAKLLRKEIQINAATLKEYIIDKGNVKIFAGVYAEVDPDLYFDVDWAKLISDLSKMCTVYIVCDMDRQEKLIFEFAKKFKVIIYTASIVSDDTLNCRKLFTKINTYWANPSVRSRLLSNVVFKGLSESVSAKLKKLKLKVE